MKGAFVSIVIVGLALTAQSVKLAENAHLAPITPLPSSSSPPAWTSSAQTPQIGLPISSSIQSSWTRPPPSPSSNVLQPANWATTTLAILVSVEFAPSVPLTPSVQSHWTASNSVTTTPPILLSWNAEATPSVLLKKTYSTYWTTPAHTTQPSIPTVLLEMEAARTYSTYWTTPAHTTQPTIPTVLLANKGSYSSYWTLPPDTTPTQAYMLVSMEALRTYATPTVLLKVTYSSYWTVPADTTPSPAYMLLGVEALRTHTTSWRTLTTTPTDLLKAANQYTPHWTLGGDSTQTLAYIMVGVEAGWTIQKTPSSPLTPSGWSNWAPNKKHHAYNYRTTTCNPPHTPSGFIPRRI